jgi:hypothetical protein
VRPRATVNLFCFIWTAGTGPIAALRRSRRPLAGWLAQLINRFFPPTQRERAADTSTLTMVRVVSSRFLRLSCSDDDHPLFRRYYARYGHGLR